MKINRRKFIIKSFFAALGSLLFTPGFVKSESKVIDTKGLKNKPVPKDWDNDKVTIAWLGHSTILINFYGKWILTDPVLFERIGLYFFGSSLGPSRLTPPALTFDEIPKPDLILLSHAHMDHMDYPTLKAIADKYPGQIDVRTAYLTSDVINDLSWKSLTEIDWNDEIEFEGIHIKALEVKHFGWRFPWEKDRSRGYMEDGRSYNAYLLSYKNKTILFGGDTAWTDKLNFLKNHNVDIALMPIGAYDPWIRNHCNPEQALMIANNINAKYFIPMHCKTFQQGSEPFDEPISRLLAASPNYNPQIVIDDIGQTFSTV